MPLERLGQYVRVLLLDNAWPFDATGNLARLRILEKLLYELVPTDTGNNLSSLSKWFDLIVARDTPFFRHFAQAFSELGESGGKFDLTAFLTLYLDAQYPDEQFRGYNANYDSFKTWDTPAIGESGSLPKLLLHNPTTEYEFSWAAAMGRGPNGLPFGSGRATGDPTKSPPGFVPLVQVAKHEIMCLYPNNQVFILEINPLLGHSSSGDSHAFIDWFQEARGEELYYAHYRTTPNSKSSSKVMRSTHNNDMRRWSRQKRERFEKTLYELYRTKPGYSIGELRGVMYQSLAYDPEDFVVSKELKTFSSLDRKLLISQDIWNSIRTCVAALRRVSPSPTILDIANQRPLRLLAFDGGGVRGLSSLLILQNVLERVKVIGNLEEAPLPCEYFDMIAGTSTGGLIAILLGRLKLSVKDCIELYEKVAQEIFGTEDAITSTTRFSSKRFKEVLQLHTRQSLNLNHDEIFLRDPDVAGGGGCPIFVVTIERERVADPEGAVILRSYERNSNLAFEESCYLWEAALATCAAPIFFSPAQVKSKFLVDGGLGHNNPTENLINEAEQRWPGREIGALVSIGTGKARGNLLARDMKKAAAGKHMMAYFHIALVLKHIATSSEARAQSVHNYFRGMRKLDCYYRLNVDGGMEVELHEYRKHNEIREKTQSYLHRANIQEYVNACARNLEGEDVDMTQTLEDTTDQLAEAFEESNLEFEPGGFLQQIVDSSSAQSIELKPVYQLDTSVDSVPARTTVLKGNNKRPQDMFVSAHDDLDNEVKPKETEQLKQLKPARPVGNLAFAFDSNSFNTKLILEHTASKGQHSVQSGHWRVHWILLLSRHDVSESVSSEAVLTDRTPNASESCQSDEQVPPIVSSPEHRIRLSASSDPGDGDKVQSVASVITLTHSSLASSEWQDIQMEELLYISSRVRGDDNAFGLRFSLDFGDLDKATPSALDETAWTIYFGGVRLIPANEAID